MRASFFYRTMIMRGMAAPQQAQCGQSLGLIVDDVDLAKGDDTLEMGRKRLGVDFILSNDAK